MPIISDYLKVALRPRDRRARIARSVEIVRKMQRRCQFEAVVVTGWSGALIGIPVADALDLPITLVRKDSSHSDMKVEGFCAHGANVLVIDDFISTGKTIANIRKHLSRWDMHVAGILLYRGNIGGLPSSEEPIETFHYRDHITGYILSKK